MEAASCLVDFIKMLKKKVWDAMGELKIVIGVFQIIGTFLSSLEVPWPDIFTTWMQKLEVFNLGMFDVASVQCMYPNSNFYNKLILQISGPIIFAISILVAEQLRVWWVKKHCKFTGSAYTATIIRHRHTIENQHIFGFTVLLFVIFPGVSSTVMKYFKCALVDGKWLLHADYRLVCYSADWMAHLPVALFGVLIYPIGIPAFIYWSLRAHKQHLHYEVKPLEKRWKEAYQDHELLSNVIVSLQGVPDVMLVRASVAAADELKAATFELEEVRVVVPVVVPVVAGGWWWLWVVVVVVVVGGGGGGCGVIGVIGVAVVGGGCCAWAAGAVAAGGAAAVGGAGGV